ncbi:MAG: PKD domain-containing protein [Steroidobacteraceae bacterium]
MRHRGHLFVPGIAALLLLTACGGGGGSSPVTPPAPAANIAPTADAGANQVVTAGTVVTLNGTASVDSDGTIAGYAWTQTSGPTVTLTNASTAQPSFTAPQVSTPASLTFSLVVTDNRGATSSAATAGVAVNPPPLATVTTTGVVRYARVPFRSTSPFGLDYASTVLQPARGVLVRAIDATTQAVLATDTTTATGSYSMVVPGNTTLTIQVVARMQRVSAPGPQWDVRVQDGITSTATPYSYTTAAFSSSATPVQQIDIPTGIGSNGTATGARASGPFAILDTLYTAISAVVTVAPAVDFPVLIVDWGSQTVGTQFSTSGGQHIKLRSDLTEDSEEFDQHVVAHEFGHYIEHNFSRSDSIGGKHSLGDRLDLRVAFGEGFGYAFAAIVLDDPFVRDSFVSNGSQVAAGFIVENNPPTSGGTASQLGCWCSESSVWAILWDLYDSNPDANDNLSLGFAPIWDVLTNGQRTTPAVTSIFSFLTALKAARPADAAAIDTLANAQNIDTPAINAFASNETHAPFSNVLPIFTSITAGVPVVVRTSDDAGHYNKLGNRRLLRFAPTTTGSVTVSLSSSNPATNVDPDFEVLRNGTTVARGADPPAAVQTATFTATAGSTYIIDAYDCANGCDAVEGTPGDYDLTVTIN